MEFNEKIKMLRAKHNLTLEDVGKVVGVGKSTVRKWESGAIANMRRDKIALLAQALHVTPAYLMGWEEDSNPISSHPDVLPVSRHKVPLLGDIAAGQPITADQQYDSYVAAGDDLECDFALKVRGDSMEPRFIDGDTVFFRSQDDVDDGQIAAVIIDDEATLKRVYHLPGGIQLISENPKYPPMIFNAENSNSIRILGLAVGYYRKLI